MTKKLTASLCSKMVFAKFLQEQLKTMCNTITLFLDELMLYIMRTHTLMVSSTPVVVNGLSYLQIHIRHKKTKIG